MRNETLKREVLVMMSKHRSVSREMFENMNVCDLFRGTELVTNTKLFGTFTEKMEQFNELKEEFPKSSHTLNVVENDRGTFVSVERPSNDNECFVNFKEELKPFRTLFLGMSRLGPEAVELMTSMLEEDGQF